MAVSNDQTPIRILEICYFCLNTAHCNHMRKLNAERAIQNVILIENLIVHLVQINVQITCIQ